MVDLERKKTTMTRRGSGYKHDNVRKQARSQAKHSRVELFDAPTFGKKRQLPGGATLSTF